MPPPITNTFKFLGVTPWQVIFGAACLGSWWGTMQPLQALPTQFRELNATVQTIATKVEVHSVLLQTVSEMRGDVQQMRRELSTIEGRLSSHTSYKQP
jgi:hypothetical protein